jgi:hypothetical protein
MAVKYEGRRLAWATALWAFAALASIGLLLTAIVGRAHGGGPTLRPMAASESMSDAEALAVAGNTIRVWVREHDAGNLANVEALTCPETHDGVIGREIDDMKRGQVRKVGVVAAVARLTRDGPTWTLDNIASEGGGEMFILRVRNGELLVCQTAAATVP